MIHIMILGSDDGKEKAFDSLINSNSDFDPIDSDEYLIYNEDDLRILRSKKISFKILGRE